MKTSLTNTCCLQVIVMVQLSVWIQRGQRKPFFGTRQFEQKDITTPQESKYVPSKVVAIKSDITKYVVTQNKVYCKYKEMLFREYNYYMKSSVDPRRDVVIVP